MKRMLDRIVRATLIAVAVVLIALIAIRFLLFEQAALAQIAHAGGRISGQDYTNSIAALDESYQLGFRIFEIDFLKTTDGRIVCGHDWRPFNDVAPEYSRFLEIRETLDHPPCDWDELAAWLESRPDTRVVSDAKEAEVEINGFLARHLGERLIAQAYGYSQVCDYRAAGVEHVILTLYRLPPSISGLRAGLAHPCVSEKGLFAVTMDTKRVYRGHALIVKFSAALSVYAHTVNDCYIVHLLSLFGADAVYSDVLPGGACRLFGS